MYKDKNVELWDAYNGNYIKKRKNEIIFNNLNNQGLFC